MSIFCKGGIYIRKIMFTDGHIADEGFISACYSVVFVKMSVAAMVMFSISIYLVPVLPLHQQHFFFADFALSLRIRNRHKWKQ